MLFELVTSASQADITPLPSIPSLKSRTVSKYSKV